MLAVFGPLTCDQLKEVIFPLGEKEPQEFSKALVPVIVCGCPATATGKDGVGEGLLTITYV